MRALLYLEWRYAIHAIAGIRRSPWRVGLWVPYALFLAISLGGRLYGTHRGVPNAAAIAPNIATAIAGLYLAMAGSIFAAAAGGRITTFRSPAEAIVFSNVGIAPLSIALWLQLRRVAGSWLRAFGSFGYLFVVFAPRGGDVAANVRAFVAAMLVVAVPLSAELPGFLLARGGLRAPVRIASFAAVACGIAFALAGFAGRRTWSSAVAWAHVDPGRFVSAIFSNDPKPILVPLAILGCFIAIVGLLGRDALPELYAASQERFASQGRLASQGRFASLQRRVAARNAARRKDVRIDVAARVPRGALALLWKDWLGFRRGPGIAGLTTGAIFWGACGAGAAYATVRFDDVTPLVTMFAATALAVVYWAPSSASTGLADDLTKPLFWLSHASLRDRLLAWSFGRAWRGATAIAIGPAVAALVLAQIPLAVMAAPLTLVAYWSLQSLGIGLYAVFPDPIDARGPIGLLRLLASIAYVVPAALVATLVVVLHGPASIAAAAFAIGLGLEGWVVVELAALRFAEYGASLGTIARTT